jgi:hypothetical protein
MKKPVIETNRLMSSALDGRIFFVRRARPLGDGAFRVIGKKYEVNATAAELADLFLSQANREGVKATVTPKFPKPKKAAGK